MKKILPILFCLMSCVSFGQIFVRRSYQIKSQPLWIIDSVVIGTYDGIENIDPKNIKKVFVLDEYNDSALNIHGKIYVTTIHPEKYHFVGINQILKDFTGDTFSNNALYSVNGQIIKDTSFFKMDESFVKGVSITAANEVYYLSNYPKDFKIIDIVLKSKEEMQTIPWNGKPDSNTKIIIRGTNLTAAD